MRAAYTTSTAQPATNLVAIARVAAATRVRAARLARERKADEAWVQVQRTGQLVSDEQDWCFICNRPTDHTGEHTLEQIAAWQAKRL